MKKITYIILGLLLIILTSAVAVPFLFKDKIIALAKEEISTQLNAKVDFKDVDLSLLNNILNFPNIALSMDGLTIVGIAPFEGDTLLQVGNTKASLDLMSVIKGEQYQINTIAMDGPRIHALVLKNGKANWDITKPSADTVAKTEEASAPFKMTLKNFEIK